MERIANVSARRLDLELENPFEIALGVQNSATNVLVTVKTDSGTVGYGEASPTPRVTGETQAAVLATVRDIAEYLEGQPLNEYRSTLATVRESVPGMTTTLFGVETAVLDAYCRDRGIPMAELFGGACHPIETDYTIPIADLSSAAERAEAAVADGFTHLKIKTGTDLERDFERVRSIRDAAPDAQLKIDANQGWTISETVRFARRAEKHGIHLELIEQPIPKRDIRGLAQLRERTDVPIAADESIFTSADALRIARADAADVVNMKPAKAGLLDGEKVLTVAEAANMERMIGCMLESAIGIHASAHLVAGVGGVNYIDLDGNQLLAEDVVATGAGPEITIDGPGHGITPEL